MAIDRGTARLLLEEHRRRPFGGSVLQLGRQAVLFSERQLRAWAEVTPVVLQPIPRERRGGGRDGSGATGGRLDDEVFFNLLGFEEVQSCDVSPYEGATLLADLNQPVPPAMHGRFDVIFNGGTLEHIFHVRAALANVHEMLRVGGRAIHIAPSSNTIDHGFYSISPTLFHDYYSANHYSILTLYLFECHSWTGEWAIYDYGRGRMDSRLGRTSSAKMAGVYCVVQKTAGSTADAVPAQTHFARLWQSGREGVRSARMAPLKEAVKEYFPGAAEMVFWTRGLVWRRPSVRCRSMPPLVRRY
jgi:SAM-dependent methyltransferase